MVSRDQLGWYVRRLRGMSVSEVAYRGLDVGRRQTWARRQIRLGDSPSLLAGVWSERPFLALPSSARTDVPVEAASGLVRAADSVLAGTWTSLGNVRSDSADPDWFFDPITGRHAPDRLLSFRIHHRDEEETGNIKQVW